MELTYNNYLELKSRNLNRAEIATEFSIPDWKLKKHIATNGWGKKVPTISNTSAFDDYNEESCYWAGFLAADGNVDSKGRIRIMLKYDDIRHLEKFKMFLGSTHSIASNTTKYNRCSFEVTNREMCEVLDLNFNIRPNKTLDITFPAIPKKYLRHFIRGYFDGDGSVCESFSNQNSVTATLYTTFACGSYDFINTLYSLLKDTLNINGTLQDFGTGKKWQIKFNTNDSKTLLEYMYEDASVYLDRKFHLYDLIVRQNIRSKR
jgi:hypothetical protein